jgi:hypothetical protein
MIEALDDEDLTLAEVTRRVGAAAERAGVTRPSPCTFGRSSGSSGCSGRRTVRRVVLRGRR